MAASEISLRGDCAVETSLLAGVRDLRGVEQISLGGCRGGGGCCRACYLVRGYRTCLGVLACCPSACFNRPLSKKLIIAIDYSY